MIYQNSRLNKKYINIEDIQLNLSKKGIYLIKGGNGCGKTTLLEYVIFDKNENNFIFNDEERAIFNKNRHNIFSYVSQKIVYSESRVDEYIFKMNSAVNIEEVHKYFQLFELPLDLLHKQFYQISGGEQIKISIITALLKRTPYVFMDEPTNYMDNSSVKKFLDIIHKEANDRVFVIVSHDPRMVFDSYYEYIFENGTIHLQSEYKLDKDDDKSLINSVIPQNNALNIIRLFTRLNKKFSFFIVFLVVILFLTGALTYTNLEFRDSIGDENENYKDSIFVYYTGGGHDQLNEQYEEAEKLNVDSSLYDVCIDYYEIPKIAENEYINAIYMQDRTYTDEIINKIESGEYNESNIIYSCPEKYYNQYGDTFRDDLLLIYTEGDLPRDGKKEIAISKNILVSQYGYDETKVEQAIGDTISIDNQEYTIVGFSYLDIVIVSFDKGTSYGYYCYDENTYSDFLQKELNYIKKNDSDGAVRDILIEVDEKYERDVLNYLVQKYPSNCYISAYFQKSFIKHQEITVFIKWSVIHILLSAIFSVIIWFIVVKANRYNMGLLWDIGNYYINRNKVMYLYVLLQCGQYCLIGLLCIVVNSIVNIYSYLTNWYIIIDCLIMIIPIFISCVKACKEVKC